MRFFTILPTWRVAHGGGSGGGDDGCGIGSGSRSRHGRSRLWVGAVGRACEYTHACVGAWVHVGRCVVTVSK